MPTTSSSKAAFLAYDDKNKKKTIYMFEMSGTTVLCRKKWNYVRPRYVAIVNGKSAVKNLKAATVESTKTALAALDKQANDPNLPAMSKFPFLCKDVALTSKQKSTARLSGKWLKNVGKEQDAEEQAKEYEIQRLNNTIKRKSTLPATRKQKIARLAELGETPRE